MVLEEGLEGLERVATSFDCPMGCSFSDNGGAAAHHPVPAPGPSKPVQTGTSPSRSATAGYSLLVSDTALLVIDMLNAYEHPDAQPLAANVERIVEPVAELVDRANRHEGVELIYVNDNHGDFTADHTAIVRNALNGARPDLVEPVLPPPNCRFLTKVRHSIFYATPLAYLLGVLDVRRIVLCGQVTEQCILYSALDGYLRRFDVVVPPDGVAHIDEALGRAALEMMRRNMRAELRPTANCLP